MLILCRASLPNTSTWAQKYSCGPQQKRRQIVDTQPGYVYDPSRQNPGSPGWGFLPRPGTAEVFVLP
jgi:hypothetical protein